jgi:flagellar assembly protein FliH
VEPEHELEDRIQQAYRQGRAEGEAIGAQHAAAQIDAVRKQVDQLMSELAGCRARLRREAEHDLVKLAIAIARRILHRQITVDPEALQGLVKAALDRLDARETFRARFHPEDLKLLSGFLGSLNLPRNLELVPDARLERGAAVFETSRGILDASVETQLSEIERGFTDLARRPG